MTDLFIDISPLLSDDFDLQDAWLKCAIDEALVQAHVPMIELSERQLRDIAIPSAGFVDRTFNLTVKNGPFANISFARCVGANNAYLEAIAYVNRLTDITIQYDSLSDSIKAALPADILMIIALKGDLGDRLDEFKRIVVKQIMAEQGYSVDG